MHLLTATRIRFIIFIFVLLILWQIFRTWPDGTELEVSIFQLCQFYFSFFFLNFYFENELINWWFRSSLSIQDVHFTRSIGAPVIVMVFYEALCPDSKHFIVKQLEHAFYKAPSLIEFQLVPYGKATVSEINYTLIGESVKISNIQIGNSAEMLS